MQKLLPNRKYIYYQSNNEYEVHSEDDGYYYHWEIVERELVLWKFPKKDCKVVGNSLFRCTNCGKRFGSNGCKLCSPHVQWWDKKEWSPIVDFDGKIKDDDYWNQNGLEKVLKERDRDWVTADWATDRYTTNYYFCHNCQYFMHHHINYCHKCGGRLLDETLKWSEMREKYPLYRRGY